MALLLHLLSFHWINCYLSWFVSHKPHKQESVSAAKCAPQPCQVHSHAQPRIRLNGLNVSLLPARVARIGTVREKWSMHTGIQLLEKKTEEVDEEVSFADTQRADTHTHTLPGVDEARTSACAYRICLYKTRKRFSIDYSWLCNIIFIYFFIDKKYVSKHENTAPASCMQTNKNTHTHQHNAISG